MELSFDPVQIILPVQKTKNVTFGYKNQIITAENFLGLY